MKWGEKSKSLLQVGRSTSPGVIKFWEPHENVVSYPAPPTHPGPGRERGLGAAEGIVIQYFMEFMTVPG